MVRGPRSSSGVANNNRFPGRGVSRHNAADLDLTRDACRSRRRMPGGWSLGITRPLPSLCEANSLARRGADSPAVVMGMLGRYTSETCLPTCSSFRNKSSSCWRTKARGRTIQSGKEQAGHHGNFEEVPSQAILLELSSTEATLLRPASRGTLLSHLNVGPVRRTRGLTGSRVHPSVSLTAWILLRNLPVAADLDTRYRLVKATPSSSRLYDSWKQGRTFPATMMTVRCASRNYDAAGYRHGVEQGEDFEASARCEMRRGRGESHVQEPHVPARTL